MNDYEKFKYLYMDKLFISERYINIIKKEKKHLALKLGVLLYSEKLKNNIMMKFKKWQI